MRDTNLAYYDFKWQTMVLLPEWEYRIVLATKRVLLGRERYERLANVARVPWVLPALLHEMECGCDFGRQILNGEPWNQVTTKTPKGLGPWTSWEGAALSRLSQARYRGLRDSVAPILQALEYWNGLGYANRGMDSPYLWSGTSHGVDGKFVESGGVVRFEPSLRSMQVGAAAILLRLNQLAEWAPDTTMPACAVPFDHLARNPLALLLQKFLNSVGERLAEDGIAGPKTSDAVRRLIGSYLSGDPRQEEI